MLICLGGVRVVLGGSWVVISRVIGPPIGVITIVTLLITPLITTHEPPSRVEGVTRCPESFERHALQTEAHA